MQTRPIVIQLELRQTGENLTGQITGPQGDPVEFSGWLGLVAALDQLVRTHGDGARLPDDTDQTTEGAQP